MYDCVCERHWNGKYRNRRSLAVDVLPTLLLSNVLIWYLVEHDVLEFVAVGRPFAMLWNCCLIVVKQEAGMSALASGSREENALLPHGSNRALQYVGDFPRAVQCRKGSNRRPITNWVCA